MDSGYDPIHSAATQLRISVATLRISITRISPFSTSIAETAIAGTLKRRVQHACWLVPSCPHGVDHTCASSDACQLHFGRRDIANDFLQSSSWMSLSKNLKTRFLQRKMSSHTADQLLYPHHGKSSMAGPAHR